MKNKSINLTLDSARNLFLFITPLVTGSIIATLPSQAGTFASSSSFINIYNLSHNPEFGATSVNSAVNNNQISPSAPLVTLFDNTDAVFSINSALALIDSSIEASGQAQSYTGSVENEATILGSFFIDTTGDSKKSFAFDVNISQNLEVSIEDPSFEYAYANAKTSFFLIDSTDSKNLKLLDFFSSSSSLKTKGNDKLFSYKKTGNFTLDIFDSYVESEFPLQVESASSEAVFSYSREFSTPTYLTLIGVKKTKVAVKTPESSSSLGLFLLGSFICTWMGIVKGHNHR